MRTRLLSSTALVGLAFFTASPAFAACSNSSPSNGDTITCSSSDTTGIQGNGIDNVNVTVNSGATITVTGVDGIRLGDNADITVNGTISAVSGDKGIAVGSNAHITIGSTGIVNTNNNGAGIEASDNSRVDVYGLLNGAYSHIGGNTGTATIHVGNGGTLGGNVNFGSSQARLIFDTGATSSGTVTTDGTDNFFELSGTGSATFNTSRFSTNMLNFDNFEKTGSGTWTLSGNTKKNWHIIEGTLIGNTVDTIGSLVNDGTLVIDQSSDDTHSGTISGSGDLVKRGGARITFTGTKSYTGSTTIEGGELVIGAANRIGTGTIIMNGGELETSGTYTLNNNISLLDDGTFDITSGTLTLAGVISGTNDFIKNGAGTLILSGVNTYSGKTILNGGLTLLSGSGTFGDGSATNLLVLNGGTFGLTGGAGIAADTELDSASVINVVSGTSVMSGDITGTGSLEKTGNGTLSLTGTNTYSGGTTITGGTLSGNTTSLQGNITNNANLVFDQAFDGTYSSVISGTGTVTKLNVGKLTLSGANTYSGITYLNGGAVRITSTDNLGDESVTNTISMNGGTLEVANTLTTTRDIDLAGAGTINTVAGTTTLSGDITGAGSLVKTGAGVLTLSGTNTYSGGTTVSAGTLIGNVDSLQGNVVNNAAVTFDQGTTGTYSGDMSGIGSLTKTGAGALTLSGNNSYSGGTTVSAGSIIGNAASLQGDIVNNAAVTFNQGSTGTYSGDMSGSGSFTKSGAGALTLSGTNTYSGGTTISAGSLIGNTVSLQGDITNDANLTFDQTANGTYSNVISGSGSVTKTGAATLTLSGTNTYSGVTNLNGGAVRITNTDNLGDESGTNTISMNGGTLEIANTLSTTRDIDLAGAGTINTVTGTTTLSGDITGAGSLVKTGSGTLTLSGTNTYSGGTTVSAGSLTGNVDSLQGNITNNASVTFDQGTTGTYSGSMTGTGNFIKLGAGNLTLSGTNSYTGGTTISAGTLTGSTTSLAGNITNNAALVISQGTAGTYAGNISGSGSLTKSGAGNVTLSGTNTYSGGTTISAGTLTGDTDSLQGNITNNAALIWDQVSAGTYTGVISGSGTLAKQGAGNLILTGTNTYSGATTVTAGRLSLNGSLTNTTSTTVSGTGVLGGTGTARNVIVNSGGTLAPGNSIGTMHVTGSVTFNSGSSYEAEFNGAGQSDLTDITGNLTINSGATLNLVGIGGPYIGSTQYTLFTTGGTVTGSFDTVTNNLAFLDETMIYAANSVKIQLDRNSIDFSDVAKDKNQVELADAINSLGGTNDLYNRFASLTLAEAQEALDDLSGEHNASMVGNIAQSANVARTTVGNHIAALSHRGASNNDTTAMAREDQSTYIAALLEPSAGAGAGWNDISVWVQALGTVSHADAQGSAPEQDGHSYGALGGIDIPFDDVGYYGMFGGYERANIDTDSQGASSNLNNFHAGIYATRPISNGFNLSGGISGTYNDIDTQRRVAVGPTLFRPQGDTTGYTASAFAEISKPIETANFAFEPYLNLGVTRSHVNGYTEKNGGVTNLTVGDMTTTNPASIIGTRIGKTIDLGEDDGTIGVNVNLGWQHTFGEVENSAQMRFATGGSGFTSQGAPIARDAAIIGLNLDTALKDGLSAYAGYDGMISKDDQSHKFTAGLKFALNFKRHEDPARSVPDMPPAPEAAPPHALKEFEVPSSEKFNPKNDKK